jgi:translocation and assembly module TamB
MSIFRVIRRIGRYSLLIFLSFLLLLSSLLWFVTTDSFQQMVRRRLVAALEHATGGKVDIGSFHAVPLRFEVEVRDLTIHGREAPGERPLAHVDSMSAIVDLSAVLGVRMAFDRLTLTHPVVHFIYYPDGTTNQPSPKQPPGATFDRMVAISVHRLEVRQGELFLDEQRIPVEFVSNDVEAHLEYSFLHRRYSGTISVGRAETQLAGYRPFSWAADTHFSIGHDEIQLRSLTATSEGSRLQGGGTLSNFRHPSFQGIYDVLLDLKQVSSTLRQPRSAGGKLHLTGSAAWSSHAYRTFGDFDLKDGAWSDPNFSTRDLAAAGKFAVDPVKISLTQVQGRALRGAFNSEMEITNWDASEKPAHSAKPEPERGTAVIKARDISLADLLASLGAKFGALKSLRLAGSLTTSSEIRWKESIQNAELSSSLSLTRPSRVFPGQLPVTATAQLSYRARPATLDIGDLNASTPATQLHASGTLSKDSELRLSVANDNLGEWTPLISAVFPQGPPLRLAGHASFNGLVSGRVDSPTVKGNLQLHNFETSVSPDGTQTRAIHWDSLSTDIQLSARDLALHNAIFRHGGATVHLDGSVGLDHWDTGPASLIRLNARLDSFDASDLEAFSRQRLGAKGKVNARLDVTGTLSRPGAQGSVIWSSGFIREYDFDRLHATFSFANERASFPNFEIGRGRLQISGKGWYDLSTHTFNGDITGKDFDLSELAPLMRSRIKVGGLMDFSATASGSLDQPDVNAQLHLRNVTFNGEPAGGYVINAVTRGPDMHVTGNSEFGQSQLAIEGTVRLRELWPAHIGLHFTHLDIDSLLVSYLHGHVTGHSAVAGDLLLEGPLRDPQRLTLTGNLSDFYAEVEKIKIRNGGPLRFAVDQQTLRIDSLHLVGDDTDLSVTGTMQLSGEEQLNLRGQGQVGVRLVQTYDPDLSGSGLIAGLVTLTGSLDSPIVRGSLQVENAAIADINLPSALSELNGTLTFSQNQLTIEKLTGKTGGGTVSFSGNAQLNGRQINFDLKANADSVRLRYPPGVSSTATASLRWSGSSSGSLLSGDITVNRLGVTPGFDFGGYLARSIQASSLPQTDPVLNNIRLDLHVVTAPDLQMQTSVLRLRGDADLRVRGNAAKPVLLGRADVFEGEAYFNGTKYRLERGGITFGTPSASNAASTVPVVDFEATTRVRDYDITLSITGPADQPKLNYRSEPPLPTNDIIGLLAFGQTTEESAAMQQSNQSAFSQQASSAMLSAALNATLSNRAQRLFGNSRIKIDPQGLATETSTTQAGPAVTIEQQVNNNLTITYTTDVAQTSQQVIRAEYFVSRNVSVVAIRDQNGIVSFDVKIRRRKR